MNTDTIIEYLPLMKENTYYLFRCDVILLFFLLMPSPTSDLLDKALN